MANLNGIAGDALAQAVTGLLNRFDPLVDQLDQYRAVMKGLTMGEIVLEQVQVLESGELRVLPPPPVMTCKDAT